MAMKEASKKKHKRATAVYLIILFGCALLLLVLAYFMQERAFAYAASQLLAG